MKGNFCAIFLASCCAFLSLQLSAHAQKVGSDACAAFASLLIPEASRPTLPQATSAGVSCSSFDLYYASSVADHFQKARFCALAQMGLFRAGTDPARAAKVQTAAAGGATEPEDIRESDGLALAMTFANGEGVPRNVPAAETLVCKFGFASQQADPSQMPVLLQSIASGVRFDLCGDDQGPQGRSVWFACASMQATQEIQSIASAQARLNRTSTPTALPPLRSLETAWSRFASADAAAFAAYCDNGTGCGVYRAQHDVTTSGQWLDKLKQIAANTLRKALPPGESFPSLDRDLNLTYKDQIAEARIGESPESSGTGKSMESLVRKAQRAWLAYREAWVKYVAVRWLDVPADSVRAWLTAERTKGLADH